MDSQIEGELAQSAVHLDLKSDRPSVYRRGNAWWTAALGSTGATEEPHVDVSVALSDANADAFKSALYEFISAIEQRNAVEEASVSVTIIPAVDSTQFLIRFERADDAIDFNTCLRPKFVS